MTLNYRSLITITRSELNDAVAAASDHIARYGPNELKHIDAAVVAALEALGFAIDPSVSAPEF
jgi:hypothetical protein